MKKTLALLILTAAVCRAEESQVRQLDSIFVNAPKIYTGVQAVRVDSSVSPGIVFPSREKPAAIAVAKPQKHGSRCCQKSFAVDFNWSEDWLVGAGFFTGLIAGIAIGATVASGGALIALGAILFAGLGAYGGHVLGNAIRRKNCKG